MPGFNVSVRPIIADTEGAAWEKANRILGAMNVAMAEAAGRGGSAPSDNAGKRPARFALESDIHDERLWMPIAATGALGNTVVSPCTSEQVTESQPSNTTGWEFARSSSAASTR